MNKNKTIMVTGGAGFIGSNLVEQLHNLGYQIFVVDNLSTGKEENCTIVPINKNDLSDPLCIPYLVRAINYYDIDLIYHVAALPRVEPSILDPLTSHKVNIDSTINLLCAIKEAGNIQNTRVVFSSSSSVYGQPKIVPTAENEPLNPMSPYALHKQMGEQYLKLFSDLYGLQAVCLRYFNVYGNRQPTEGSYVPVIGIWMEQMRKGLPLTITGNGEQVRDFVCVDDVIQANIKAGLSCDRKFAIYNVGSGENYSLIHIAKEMFKTENIKFIQERIEPKYTLADINKIKSELDYKPTINLEEWIGRNK